MKQLDFVDKYFQESCEYPSDLIMDSESMLKEGVLYCYISSTFLNGFINYITPVKAFIIDRYRNDDQLLDTEKKENPIIINMHYGNFGKWENLAMFTKQEVIDKLNNGYKIYHTKIGMFDDDVLLLAKTKNYYWYFWFDCDVSDCCIGRFKTTDAEEEIISSFTKYCNQVTEYKLYEFKLDWLQGWLSF